MSNKHVIFSAERTEELLVGVLTHAGVKGAVDIAKHSLQIKYHKDNRFC